jgi:hypothetical protein
MIDRYKYYQNLTSHAGSAATLVLAEQLNILVGLLRNVDHVVTTIEQQQAQQTTGDITVRVNNEPPQVVQTGVQYLRDRRRPG